MIRVTVELVPHGDEERKREIGRLEIANDGSGDEETGNYTGRLFAEYTPEEGRRGRLFSFARQRQSVWSLIGGFLKLWGHTRHSPTLMSK